MGGERAQPPAGLRPAQLGIVLIGRVILGHISATLVDLDQRGLLEISEIPGDGDQDWLLARRRDAADAPLRFEATLLDGLFAGQPAVRLTEITQGLVPTLNRVRAQLHRDAVRHGRLRRWHRGEPRPRTKRGEQLLTQIHSFRQELRGLAASGDALAMARLAPYLIMFGLGGSSPVRVASGNGTGPASRLPLRTPGHALTGSPWAGLPRSTRFRPFTGTAPAPVSLGTSSRSGPRLMVTAATATAARPADTAGVTLAATSAGTAGEAGSLAATATERLSLLTEPRTAKPAAENARPAAQ